MARNPLSSYAMSLLRLLCARAAIYVAVLKSQKRLLMEQKAADEREVLQLDVYGTDQHLEVCRPHPR